MAEAARQIAALTSERLPQIRRIERHIEVLGEGRPRLGVTIGDNGDRPVEGVRILGVTPGSAASEGGLRSGDIITAINGESLSAENPGGANEKLVDFMRGVEEGDTVAVEYLREGKVGRVELEPRASEFNVFAFDAAPFRAPGAPGMHAMPKVEGGPKHHYLLDWRHAGWADMELVELNEGLGRYFGTDKGLLVVRAPRSDILQLEDGDVIHEIDGRTPTSVRHAMRILGSYQPGEKLELEIMRDKRRRKLDIDIPDDLTGRLGPIPPVSIRPSSVDAPRKAFAPVGKT